MNRRNFMMGSAGALLGLSAANLVERVQAQDGNQAAGMIDRNTQQSIERSLDWLSRQQHADGSFGTGQYNGNVAVTSLAGLAFMAGGHQPGRGIYGEHVTRAVRNIINFEDRNRHPGFLNNARAGFHGPMYGHGFATLFLAEVYGMVNEPNLRSELRATLSRAITLIINTQNNEGGWRYQPVRGDADLSVTICQIMALRAARNAGINVPAGVARRCTEYVQRCQDNSGGFRYQSFGGAPGFARTAAGVVALYSAGIYEGQAVERGLAYLDRFRPGGGGGGGGILGGAEMQMHYYYGHYYAVQAMWIAGGAYWRNWYPAIRNELMARRRADGSWDQGLMCSNYSSAMALIILQVPNNYLPILQR